MGRVGGGRRGTGSGWAQMWAGSRKEGGVIRGGWDDPTGKGEIPM